MFQAFISVPNQISGFTLAEVLITIGIIGVVAAMTLPSLIADYQKKQTATQLKKSYSIISQALTASQYENGDMTEWGMNNMGDANGDFWSNYKVIVTAFVNKYFIPYLNVQGNCGIRCSRQNEVKRYRLNGDLWLWNDDYHYVVYLADGTIVSFMFDNINGILQWVYLYVDINGDKKPNISGKDIFTFGFYSETNKINMIGGGKTRSELLGTSRSGCNKNAGSYAGDYCGAVIQYDNWEIKDDYPW